MNPLRNLLLALVLAATIPIVPGGVPIAHAQTGAPKGDVLRPEIGNALQAADELVKARKFGEALAKLREVEAIADRTPYENFAIDRLRGAAAIEAGETQIAIQSFEALVASGRLAPADQLNTMDALARASFRARDYPKAASWASRYFKEGGTDPQVRLLLARSLYFNDEFASAAMEARAVIEADEKAGVTPAMDRLQLLASCYIKLNDSAGYVFALEKYLVYYPKKEYWADAIRRVETRAGFAERLTLDAFRLRQATDNLTSAADYTAMAQLALTAGYPAEAKRILEQGYTAGALGTGADADSQRRLRDLATRQAAEDEKLLAKNARDAGSAKDGAPLVAVGFAMVTAGQFDKGLALMEQGIRKGGIKRPDDANLHLAIAYLAAGQKAKAIQAFKTVQGADGTGDLARLWLIHAQRLPG
jgi:hypothetical protein